MQKKFKITKDKGKFYYLKSGINDEFLKRYYEKKYFKTNKNFNYKFSSIEEKYFKAISNIKFDFIKQNLKKKQKPNLLDVGSGTGRFAHYISNRCNKITLVDFDAAQLQYKLKKNMKFYKTAPEQYIKENKINYDIIVLNNVIEHVLDPKKFLKLLRMKINKKTLVFIALPNDFSELQMKLIKMKKVKKKYWINFPDHISYFNYKNFVSLVKLLKFKVLSSIGDFPVELLLLSKDLNYVNDKKKGKQAHDLRCQSINYLYENNKSEDILKTLSMFSKLGIGRNNYFLLKK